MATRGIAPQAARALVTVFNEDEQAVVARLRVMLTAAPESGLDIRFFFDGDGNRVDIRPPSIYVEYSQAQAVEEFRRSSEPAALLVTREDPLTGWKADDLGNGWFLYVHD